MRVFVAVIHAEKYPWPSSNSGFFNQTHKLSITNKRSFILTVPIRSPCVEVKQ